MRISPPLSVDAGDARTLSSWVETEPDGSTAARRALIVLLSGKGLGPSAIADEVGCSKQMAITWRERYRADGLAGLRDAPRSGRPATVDAAAVIARTLEGPPAPLRAARWSTRLLAAELGISNAAVANVWRTWGVTPGPGGDVRLSTEPPLDLPITAVAGLCLDPPVRLLALRVGAAGSGREPAVPVAQRPRIGSLIAAIDSGDPAIMAEPTGTVAAFLTRLGSAGPQRLALLVQTPHAAVEAWAGRRPGVPVHAVPPGRMWDRVAQVACILAGAGADGAASVVELREAMAEHAAPGPFRWIRCVATDAQ